MTRTNPILLKQQRGATVLAMALVAVMLILVAVAAMKIIPAYIEFGTIKKGVVAAKAGGTTIPQIKNAFERAMDINGVDTVKKDDLEITKEGNEIIVTARYDKKIPMFQNLFVLIEFNATSKDQ